MDKTLDPLDRATMATWRAFNMLAWGGVALAAALMVHTVADEVAERVHRFNVWTLNGRPLPEFGTWQFYAPSFGYKAFVAIVIGVVIGLIVGSKVSNARAWVAGGIASAYALVSLLMLETSLRIVHPTGDAPDSGFVSSGFSRHGLPRNAREWSYSLLALLAVAVAPLVARAVARRKAQPASPGTP